MSTKEQAPDGKPPSETVKPSPSRPKKIDPIYYNWSSTFKIMLGRMTGGRDAQLERGYFEEMDAIKEESYCRKCETNRDYLLSYSPIVRFMRDEIGKLGGDINGKNMICRMCESWDIALREQVSE